VIVLKRLQLLIPSANASCSFSVFPGLGLNIIKKLDTKNIARNKKTGKKY
jgi:hypothetical protein